MRRFQFLLIFVLILFNSCSKDDEADETSIIVPEVDRWEVNRSNQYALNVVLFVPTDFSADEVLVNEVSDVMLYIQKWYEKQMELNGFGKKTFGKKGTSHQSLKRLDQTQIPETRRGGGLATAAQDQRRGDGPSSTV